VSITGVVSITHVYEVALPFPAASIAWTTKVCEPTPRPEYVFGLVQEGFEPLSSRQWNLTPASLSEKLKLAVVAFVGLAGLLPIVGAGGGVVSTVHERVDRLHAERVRPVAETRVGHRAEAERERATVDLALEGDRQIRV
jgi:hypothetical protein